MGKEGGGRGNRVGRVVRERRRGKEGEEEKARGTGKGNRNEEKWLGQRAKEGNGARGRENRRKEGMQSYRLASHAHVGQPSNGILRQCPDSDQ